MSARFCTLASGSAGNCAYLQSDGFGLLIDLGLGPRYLASRLAVVGAKIQNVHAVLLTHTHGDHWKDASFGLLHQHGIPLYCSPRHHAGLIRFDGYFEPLRDAGLVRPFDADEKLELPGGMVVRSIAVPHDSEPTLAFRIDGPDGLFGPQWSVGYAADLGVFRDDLLEHFLDVDLLALEFNHCEQMQRASGRPRILIDRVLGDFGHLSNHQAADAVRAIVKSSSRGTLRNLVQLHLSRDCNRHRLAGEFGRKALADVGSDACVFTSDQFAVSKIIALDRQPRRNRAIVSA